MKYSSNSILAHIPAEKSCEPLLEQVLFFKHALKTRLFIVDIIKVVSPFSRLFLPNQVKKHHKTAYDELNQFVKNVLHEEIPKDIILRMKQGDIVKTLIKESQKGGYDFMIIDKSHEGCRGALSRNEIDRFISKSHCPVLALNKDIPVKQIKKIVIPIDISQTTKKRLYWATLFAKRFGAKIQIVSALNINIKETKSLAFKNAEKIKKMLIDRGIKCDVKIIKVTQQEKHKILLNYIQEEGADMVIIRTHQELQFSGKKIGRFVSEIINKSNVAVFSVGGVSKKLPLDFD